MPASLNRATRRATRKFSANGRRLTWFAIWWKRRRNLPTIKPKMGSQASGSGRDLDVQLHLGMDAAEHQVAPLLGEGDLNGFARLLRAGVEFELLVEDADIVRARVVVQEPKPLAAFDAHPRRREHL